MAPAKVIRDGYNDGEDEVMGDVDERATPHVTSQVTPHRSCAGCPAECRAGCPAAQIEILGKPLQLFLSTPMGQSRVLHSFSCADCSDLWTQLSEIEPIWNPADYWLQYAGKHLTVGKLSDFNLQSMSTIFSVRKAAGGHGEL